MEFNSSERSTLGVEVEYWVVDDVTGLPVACSVNVLAEAGAPYGGEHPKAKHELFQSSIEVITGICETPRRPAPTCRRPSTSYNPAGRPRRVPDVLGHPPPTWSGKT